MRRDKTKPAGTRGYVYVRTSKDVQDKRSQRAKVERWLEPLGLQPLDWIEDSGPRDVSYKREGFQRLMQLVQKRQVDWVVIAERDRLGYQDAWEYGYFIHTFRTHGTQLWCVSENKELTGCTDRFEPILATLEADKSKGEQGGNADRCHRNKRAVVERGEWPGGKPPWGFDLVAKDRTGKELWRLVYEPGKYRRVCYYPDGTAKRFDGKHNTPRRNRGEILVPEPTRDPAVIGWVKQVFAWYAEGYSAKAIATQLNNLQVPPLYTKIWLGPTIQKTLENPIYATGRPTWNKCGHGRFLEFVNGEYVPVERVDGRAKAGRKRTPADYIQAPPKPENAIIDLETWNAVQARIQASRAAPKLERRPRNPELYLSGLVVCSDCGQPMVAWAQQEAYRCSTNMHYTEGCRCNRTRHDVLEELVLLYLEQTQHTLGFLYEDPDHCREVMRLEEESQPLVTEYVRRLTAMWQQAKAAGQVPLPDSKGLRVWTHEKLRALSRPAERPRTDDFKEAIQAKEDEKARLVRRLGLLDDEEAAKAVAVRIGEVSAELRELRSRAKPVEDQLDALRVRLRELLEQTIKTRQIMAESLPRRKGEYIRKLVRQIRVFHEERRMGQLRASRLIRVEIVPAAGQPESFDPPPDEPSRQATEGYGGPAEWKRCGTVFNEGNLPSLCDETQPEPG
jgi:DNA invertase Pin-like site-specific DNA recombinase